MSDRINWRFGALRASRPTQKISGGIDHFESSIINKTSYRDLVNITAYVYLTVWNCNKVWLM